MNTDTHEIRATYTVGDTNEWHEVDINGYGLAEIVGDMLDFWNEVGNRATAFTIDRVFNPGGYATITEIVGEVYGHYDGIVDMSIVETVTVHVTATER